MIIKNIMKIYVAGKITDGQKIKEYMDQIEKLGHSITHDWTSFEIKNDEDDIMGGDGINKKELIKHNIDGIRACDTFVAIMDDKDHYYAEAWTELGCALGLNKRIIILCPRNINGISIKLICTDNFYYDESDIIHVDYWSQVIEMIDIMDMFE